MYLRRFAQKRKKGHFISALPVGEVGRSATFTTNVKGAAARSGYNIGIADDGEAHHDAERLFSVIESAATHGFKAMLDDPHYALPRRWPLRAVDRQRVSWWLAAQILRTNRQRRRLVGLSDENLAPRAPFAATSATTCTCSTSRRCWLQWRQSFTTVLGVSHSATLASSQATCRFSY